MDSCFKTYISLNTWAFAPTDSSVDDASSPYTHVRVVEADGDNFKGGGGLRLSRSSGFTTSAGSQLAGSPSLSVHAVKHQR